MAFTIFLFLFSATAFGDPKPNPMPDAPTPAPPPSTSPPLPPILAGPTPFLPTAPENPSDSLYDLSGGPPPDVSSEIQYIPPSDPNLFAPNIHSHYPPSPPSTGETRFNGLTRYLPPAAGPVVDNSSAYLNPPDSPPSNQYIPPADLFQFPPNIHSHYLPPPMDDNIQTDGLTSYLPPPAGPPDSYLPPPPEDSSESSPPIKPNSTYLPPPEHHHTEQKDVMPPSDFHGYEYNHPHDHYPEYIFDHDHDHHHHHYDEPPPTTTSPAPPPKDDRKKNYGYNYYYLSTFLWYTPLYFTIYIGFYILVILLRGIGRRVVDYPNKYTGRSLGASRALQEMRFLTNEQAAHKADVMAQFVMKQIDDFKQRQTE